MEIYLHVGAAKAASTTLQNSLFPMLEQAGFRYLAPSSPLTKQLTSATVGADDQSLTEVAEELFALGHDKILISSEGLSIGRCMDGEEVAARVCRHLGSDVRIVFVLRDPLAWLQSRYRQDFKRNMSWRGTGYLSFGEWVSGRLHETLAVQNPVVSLYRPLPRADFARILRSWEARVGLTNLCTLELEVLKSAETDFLLKFLGFIGVGTDSLGSGASEALRVIANPSMTPLEMRIHAQIDRVMGKKLATRARPLSMRIARVVSAGRKAEGDFSRGDAISSLSSAEMLEFERYLEDVRGRMREYQGLQ